MEDSDTIANLRAQLSISSLEALASVATPMMTPRQSLPLWMVSGIEAGPILLLDLKPPHKLVAETLRTSLDDGTGLPQRRFETKPIIDSPPRLIIQRIRSLRFLRKSSTI
jgi:hypothetical protein